MEIKTSVLKKAVNKTVKYKVKGSNLWSVDIIREIVNNNIIFDGDSRHFSQISEIVLIEKQPQQLQEFTDTHITKPKTK